jgi:hypothetical protein
MEAAEMLPPIEGDVFKALADLASGGGDDRAGQHGAWSWEPVLSGLVQVIEQGIWKSPPGLIDALKVALDTVTGKHRT